MNTLLAYTLRLYLGVALAFLGALAFRSQMNEVLAHVVHLSAGWVR